uniref:Uncharacterized protein n=1 Tax=Rhizophora mucronata TaxID=61149 RepID=A0A2P2P335_RHIMU
MLLKIITPLFGFFLFIFSLILKPRHHSTSLRQDGTSSFFGPILAATVNVNNHIFLSLISYCGYMSIFSFIISTKTCSEMVQLIWSSLDFRGAMA